MLYRVGYALGEVAKNADNVGLDPAYLVETVKLQQEMANSICGVGVITETRLLSQM